MWLFATGLKPVIYRNTRNWSGAGRIALASILKISQIRHSKRRTCLFIICLYLETFLLHYSNVNSVYCLRENYTWAEHILYSWILSVKYKWLLSHVSKNYFIFYKAFYIILNIIYFSTLWQTFLNKQSSELIMLLWQYKWLYDYLL